MSRLSENLDRKDIQLLGHFHDSLYLKCSHKEHQVGDKCPQIEKTVQDLENSLDFF
jgi:hypothetical protein